MSRFLLLACLSLLAGCLSPPGGTVAAPGPSEFLLEGSIVLSAGEFSMVARGCSTPSIESWPRRFSSARLC